MKHAKQQAGGLSLQWGLRLWGRKLAMLQLRKGSRMQGMQGGGWEAGQPEWEQGCNILPAPMPSLWG